MVLIELIKYLENLPQNLVLPRCFDPKSAHSYRGYYRELAFEPGNNVTVAELLTGARACIGATFGGYKGGEYTMDGYTEVNLANYGSCGETIGEELLHCWLLLAGHNPETFG